jgi:hypothetical protein
MAKVLIERPRVDYGGAARGYERAWQRVPLEDRPLREGMKRRCRGGSKAFTDLLGPLKRFLRKQVGRPWDLVHSEICAQLRGGFPERPHFLRHVFDYVQRHVVVVDGVPCVGEGRGYGEPLARQRFRPFYVCPRTGLLREVRPSRRGKRARRVYRP